MNSANTGSRLWSIVCGGGEPCVGSLIRNWLGIPKPKQYCVFVGTRSLLQHTVDRAAKLSGQAHIVTVVSHGYERDARSQLRGRAGSILISPPAYGKTAAAIYVPLTYIRARDPEATVVVYPSDHFVYPEHRFLHSIQQAVWVAERRPERIVLLGIPPDHLELDYGWIMPGERLDGPTNYRMWSVHSFLEQPTAAQADAALAAGSLWNTFVLAAKAEVLWEMGWQYFPSMMSRLERLAAKIGTLQEADMLDAVYQGMPAYDFSSDLLQRVPGRIAVVEMTGVLWSDWGKPERITSTLRRIGLPPAFPLTCLNQPFAPLPVGDSEIVTIS